jgi:hypothetical protein
MLYHRFMRRLLSFALAFSVVTPSFVFAEAQLDVSVKGGVQMRSIPAGAQRVEVLGVTFSNTTIAPVTVLSVTVHHRGLGATDEILRVYAVEGSKRLSRGFTVPRSGNVTLRFRPVLTLAPREKRAVSIVVDFASDVSAASEHSFTLDPATDIDAGDVSIRGARTIGGTTRTSPSTNGAISVSYLDLPSPLHLHRNEVVARIKLTANAIDDHRITAITLTNDGSMRDDKLQNLYLESNRGQLLTDTVPQLTGDTVTLTFDPAFLLKKGESVLLNLRGTVRTKRKTIKFVLEEPSDIVSEVVRGRR